MVPRLEASPEDAPFRGAGGSGEAERRAAADGPPAGKSGRKASESADPHGAPRRSDSDLRAGTTERISHVFRHGTAARAQARSPRRSLEKTDKTKMAVSSIYIKIKKLQKTGVVTVDIWSK